MPNPSKADADIIRDAYAEKLQGLYDTFFLASVQSPDNPGPAKDAFVRGVILARAVRDMAISALPADGTPPPEPFHTIAKT
ncbi:hypothetical protein [Dyella nitratireducens]|uniref:Uncharacterized protein n=1 Tax=Dyella nitratireducens TaxID=1849580 RepID=A0ABQ1GW14_9GAMM|nr:hypothetical protein [Dyella nitratireducens]GGA51513.1 hypothetical protein GCM10010981_46140 [Dyella nitratireducens]GLQ41694.1 hypothetical protein GCM10007902_15440 [Dyella nitratireducens]